MANGDLTTARNPLKIFVRDWILWFMQLIPSLRRKLELGPRSNGMVRYKYVDGMAFLPDLFGGRQLPQVYCRAVGPSTTITRGGKKCVDVADVDFTDNVIFRPESSSFLRLLVLADDMDQVSKARDELRQLKIEHISNNEVKMDEVCYLIMSPDSGADVGAGDKAKNGSGRRTGTIEPVAKDMQRVYRVATGDDFAASSLCTNRPPPIGYDMFRIKVDLGGRKYILARPDRFTFAACNSGEELADACRRISGVLFGGDVDMDNAKTDSRRI